MLRIRRASPLWVVAAAGIVLLLSGACTWRSGILARRAGSTGENHRGPQGPRASWG